MKVCFRFSCKATTQQHYCRLLQEALPQEFSQRPALLNHPEADHLQGSMNDEPQDIEAATPTETMECEKDIVALSYFIFQSEVMTVLLGTKWKW